MFLKGMALIIVFAGGLMLWSAGRLLWHRGWLLGWLRGMTGFAFIAASGVFALATVDIFSYRQLEQGAVATLNFDALGAQHFRVLLVDAEGNESRYELRGDQWQLDARVINGGDTLAWLGATSAYRLDRLGGRYYALEKESQTEPAAHALATSVSIVDVWQWLQQWHGSEWIDTRYASVNFMPMADGALYEVSLSHAGLSARPLNDRAQEAVNRWK